MTRFAFSAAVATAAIVLTACGGADTADSGPSASSAVTSPRVSAPASTSTAPAPSEAPPVPTVSKPPVVTSSGAAPTADPCAVVTREYLITTLRMTGGPRFPLADLEQPKCAGTYATARSVPDGQTQPSMYLFQYSEQGGQLHWRVTDVGSALDCVNRHGVPAQVARQIGCGG
ncbi:hypothetical protein ACWDYH_11345 [Nocardia goodfellowii]